MTVRCPHCGAVNRSGSNFCNNCGVSLRADDEAETAVPPAQDEPEERRAAPQAEDAESAMPMEAWAADQPWLQSDAELAAETTATDDAAPLNPIDAPARRLIANVQGLLEPVRVFSPASDERDVSPVAESSPAVLTFGADQLRRLRMIMSEEPRWVENVAPPVRYQLPALRNGWIALLVGGIVALSFWFGRPPGLEAHPQQWPGVAEAYAAIEQTPIGSPVLLLWGYDPATAGEMDLLASPLLAHLNARQNQIILISLLPNGLATARRAFVNAANPPSDGRTLRLAVAGRQFFPGVFLPEGSAALPLLGQDLPASLNLVPGVTPAAVQAGVEAGPALAILLAAQAEDVQAWLEQVRPLNNLPTVAFTSAAADPVLRPYLVSGQLAGLVSGFDGAWSYNALSAFPLTEMNETRLMDQPYQQGWGEVAFLLVILLGNLFAFLGRGSHG